MLSNGSEHLRNVIQYSNGIKIAFFTKKFQKIAQQLGASMVRPQTPKASGGCGPRPQTPVCDTFKLH